MLINFLDFRIEQDSSSVQHMSRRKIGIKVDALYTERMTEIKKLIPADAFLCPTADIWTAMNRRFIGVTLHWVIEFFIMQ